MMPNSFVIPHMLPNLNDIIKAKGAVYHRGGKRISSAYTTMKKKEEASIVVQIIAQGAVPDEPYTRIAPTVTCIEGNRRRDPDNVAAGAQKFIFDAMVAAKVIKNDGFKNIASIDLRFGLDKENPRIEVSWEVIA